MYFTGGSSPALYRTVFTHPETEILVAARGRSKESTGGFTWTPAVQAISYFLVKSLASYLKNRANNPYVLCGSRGSLAVSIIYAIQKSNAWLFDMFGSTLDGLPLFKSFLEIENIALRNARPTSISLKPSANLIENITIYIDESSVRDISILETLADAIGGDSPSEQKTTSLRTSDPDIFDEALGWNKANLARESRKDYSDKQDREGKLPAPFADRDWHFFIKNILLVELDQALRDTPIFSKGHTLATINKLKKNLTFKKYSQGANSFLHKIDLELTEASRVGVFPDEDLLRKYFSKDSEEIRVCLSATQVGALAIFYYLKYVKGFNLEINLNFTHSSAICEFIKKEHFIQEPDICCLSVSPAAHFIASQKTYRALMLLPSISYRVIAPKSAVGLSRDLLVSNHKLFYLHHDQFSTSRYYFEELVEEGYIKKRQVKLNFLNPRNLFHSFADSAPEARAILGFPYYHFDSIINQSISLSQLFAPKANKETFAFVHQRVLKDEKRAFLLNVAIRDAWMNLKNNHSLREAIICLIAKNRDYLSLIGRYGGLEEIVPQGNSLIFKDSEFVAAEVNSSNYL